MSFTDGKQRIATDEECKLDWNCGKNGKYFRCFLCGYRFEIGDKWRFIYGMRKTTNYFACDDCDDGDNESMAQKGCEHYKEYKRRFWYFAINRSD